MVQGITLKIIEGGIITGRATTQDGRPLIGVNIQVNPAPFRPSSELRTSNYQTDDRGIYRIYGLNPGEYFVSFGGLDAGKSTFPLTFYPASSEKGEPVIVRAGEEKNRY